MDTGLLLLRLFLAVLVLGHGAQKAFGAFGGLGPTGTAPIFEMWGLRPGRQLVLLAASVELVGATLLAFGLFSPAAAAMLLGVLTVAASVNADKGLWAVKGGYELPLSYGVLAAGLAFTGPGAYSLDAALDLTSRKPVMTGLVAVVVGLAAAAVFIAMARRALSRTPSPRSAS